MAQKSVSFRNLQRSMSKEMIYIDHFESSLLEYNTYKGYNYAVVSQGAFPCGYVEIPPTHPYYGADYMRCDIQCHGGLTFGGKLSDDLKLPTNTFWLGWDYGHVDDLCGLEFRFFNMAFGKAYTTEDVIIECRSVIEQLEAIKCKKQKMSIIG